MKKFITVGPSDETRQLIPRFSSFVKAPVNPFMNNLHLSTAQKVQVAFMTVFVVPVRLIMMLIILFFTWLVAFVATIGFRAPIAEPAGPIRAVLFNVVSKLGRIMYFFMGFHRIRVRGKRTSCKEAPILIVAPHSSMMDMFFFFHSTPPPSGLAAAEFARTPFLATIGKILQPIYVFRDEPDSRLVVYRELRRRISVPGSWPQIAIFPEGTCTNRQALITFKLGAFIPAVPVQPVVINYSNDYDSFSWTVGSPNPMVLVWLSLCHISIKASVHYLPTYVPSEDEMSDAKLYANNVRAVMAEAATLPCTEHSYEDCRLMSKAASLDLPENSGLVEYTKLNQKLGMGLNAIQERLEEFSKITSNPPSGLVSLDDFAKHLKLPVTPALRNLFNMYDRTGSGFIDFREYVLGLSLTSSPVATESTLKLAFELFDDDSSGKIAHRNFNEMMHAAFGVQLSDDEVFGEIQRRDSGSVTYQEFVKFLNEKPAYARIFECYQKTLQESAQNEVTSSDVNNNNNNKEADGKASAVTMPNRSKEAIESGSTSSESNVKLRKSQT